MTNKEFKTMVGAVKIELAEISAHGTINDLAAWYERNIKWATGLTEKQHNEVMSLYEAAYDLVRLEKGGKSNMTEETVTTATEEVATEEVTTATEEVATEETKPEVLTGEVVAVDAKTIKAVDAAIDRVTKKLAAISNGYLAIVGDVAKLYDLKAWEVTKHNNIYEMCDAKFDHMSRGTVNNLLSIFKRFGDKETYKLTDEAKERSVRSLLEQIKTEKAALKAEKNGGAIGTSEDGESGDAESKDTKNKAETLLNVSFDIIGGEWDIEALAEELKKALEKGGADLSADCTVTLTITR